MTGVAADLHIHSIHSDGLTQTDGIIEFAIKAKLEYISITDHDTVDAYKNINQEAEIHIIPGIEFSARYGEHSVHVLGYFKSFEAMDNELAERINDRYSRAREMIEKINTHGYCIDISDIEREAYPSRVLGRPHIARAMVNLGLEGNFETVFRKYIGSHASCYVRKKEYSVEDTVRLIHRYNGLAVIAHPDISGITHMLEDIVQCGVDGIEVFNNNTASCRKRLVKFALQNNMIITGGSDYHGNESYIPQGLLRHHAEDFMEKWRQL